MKFFNIFIVHKTSSKKSFTLIEMVIAIGLLSLTLTATAGILISVVKSFQKQSALQRIERNGDLVLRTIEEKVRKAKFVKMEKTESIPVGTNGEFLKYNMITVKYEDAAGVEKTEYIGVARRHDVGGEDINYLFVSPTLPTGTYPDIDNVEKYKVTDDSCNTGVNLVLTPGLDVNAISVDSTSIPNWVSVKIEVQLASCVSGTYLPTGISKTFETLVIARGTY